MSNYPNFIIGGAAKSGTTSLSRYLNAHQDIYLPSRELNFFPFCESKPEYTVLQRPIVSDFREYGSYFRMDRSAVKGEKSVSYLYKGLYPQTIRNIIQYHPSGKKVKMIFLLRDPVERAWSQYIHNLNIYETLPFQQAVEAWPGRCLKGWVPAFDYLGAGLYYEALKSYLSQFPQVKVYLFEDLKDQTELLLQDVFAFLEVENRLPFNSSVCYNPSSIPVNKASRLFYSALTRNPAARRLKKMISAGSQLKVKNMITSITHNKPELPEDTRRDLILYFRVDIEKLQDLIKRDLGNWLI